MIMVLGSSGFIGSEFKRQLGDMGIYPTRDELSCLSSFPALSRADYVINCVGTCTECEKRVVKTYESNVEFPIRLASSINGKFIHIGTTVTGNYWYGLTKAFADEAIKRLYKNYTIYRLPWIYGNDFIKYIKDCVDNDKEAVIYHESGYPSTKEKCVKYILDNLDNYNNEIISLGGEPRTKAGWAVDNFPTLKFSYGARGFNYECIKPDVIL